MPLAYRSDFLIDFFSSALVPVCIQLILWYSIFHKGGASSFAGMTYPELLAYTWTSILFSQIRGGDYDFGLIEMIRTGTLNNYLLRPVGVIEFTFFRGLGDKLITATFCFILGVIAITRSRSFQLVHLIARHDARDDGQPHPLSFWFCACGGCFLLGKRICDSHGEEHGRESSLR